MGTSTAIALWRRAAASLSLGATAAGFAFMAAQEHMFDSLRLGLAGVGLLTALAAVGMLRRSVMAQVLARGMAWVVLLPTAFDAIGHLLYGQLPGLENALLAATSAGALLLARPALHTDEAKAEFSPVAYRRWFLGGSVASVVASIVTAASAAGEVLWGETGHGLGLTALAAVLLASAVGVVRMRAWGVLLGAVTSLGMLGAAMLTQDGAMAMLIGLGALPGLLLTAPLLAAKLRPPETPAAPMATAGGARATWFHVAAIEDAEDDAPAVRARVADADGSDGDGAAPIAARATAGAPRA